MDAERQRIINECARIAAESEQIIIDVEHWNDLHPEQEPIHPDPDGRLARIIRAMKATLASEAKLGNYPSIVPMKPRRRKYIPMEG